MASSPVQTPKEIASQIHASTSSHMNALQSKHAGLEARLRDEMARPSPDAAMVQDIKKQKLRLKEEIARG